MSFLQKLGILGLFLFFPAYVLFAKAQSAKATQLITVFRGLKENREVLRAIDATITNSGTPEEKKYFRRALQHHVEAELLHLELDLDASFQSLKRTQDLAFRLYEITMNRQIDEVWNELNRQGRLAAIIPDPRNKHYLELGYREIAVAREKLLIAKNQSPYLVARKLMNMLLCIKNVKQAYKYVILLGLINDAAVPSEIPEEHTFVALQNEILRVIKFNTDKYILFLFDSHFLSLKESSMYDTLWQDPKLEELATPVENIDTAYIRKYPDLPIPKKPE